MCFFTVTVTDIDPPLITCPGNISQNTFLVVCNAALRVRHSSPTRRSSDLTVICSPTSGSTFQKGSHPVHCHATEAAGNIGPDCTFNVIVSDHENPVLSACPGNITATTPANNCNAAVSFAVPTATDNCGTPTVNCIPSSGSTFPLGVTMVTCTATDTSGNHAQCTFNVTVLDTTPPHITCPGNISTHTDAGACSAILSYSASAIDNCPGTLNITCYPLSPHSFDKGLTQVNCTAVDPAGNSSMCFFNVTVTDIDPPVITCPGNISQNTDPGVCNAAVSFSPTATDNCPGAPTVICSPISGSTFEKGSHPVHCHATDAAGNMSADCTFNVIVSDHEDPVLSACPGNITASTPADNCNAAVSFAVPSATDN